MAVSSPSMTEPSRIPADPAAHALAPTLHAARLPARDRLEAWRSFLVSHSLVTRRLDEELRVEGGLTLAEYDALVQLANADDGRLRMNQLADQVLLSRSGVTRLVDRLVADGLVARVSCPSDARGSMAVLTDRGRDALRHASQTHLRGVERYFTSALTDEDLVALRRALDAVIDASTVGTAFDRCSTDAPAEDPATG